MTYLRWQDAPAWMACAGRPALEESEGEVPEAVAPLTGAEREALAARQAALEGALSVEVQPLQSLPVGAITGERGALAWGSVVLAEYTDHAALEVYPPDRLLALAALVKYSLLVNITATNVGTPEALYAYGAQVTEAAQLSLNLRQSVTALEHLVPGEYCPSCRSAYRCPALTREVHATVFGEVEAIEDPDARPRAVPQSVDAASDWGRHVLAKLPAIEAWVRAVKVAAGMLERPTRRAHRKKKPARRRTAPPTP